MRTGFRSAVTVIEIGAAELEIRASIATRHSSFPRCSVTYLCLYDDEIDQRAEAFFARLAEAGIEAAALHLELTDIAFIAERDGDLSVLRGGACPIPLYHSTTEKGLRFTTALPIASAGRLSRSGIIMAAAAACQHSSYEPNAFTKTPLAGWRRVRRASISRFTANRLDRSDLIDGQPPRAANREEIAGEVQAAFLAYGRSQTGIARSVLEVSGGFDSTLAATTLSAPQEMHGISSVYPYYEFRDEVDVQARVARELGIPRTVLDGTTLFPYAPSDEPVRWDEPSVYVTGIRHAEQVARFAAQRDAQRIYMGHGGDQCFSTDLTAREGLVDNPPGRGPFSAESWAILSSAMKTISTSPWMARSAGTFVYDARQDIWAKERYGLTIRTPFSDLRIFRAGQLWSDHSAATGKRPDKSILVDALGSYLPDAVVQRKGKTAYDGVWMRAYERHTTHISDCFDRAAGTLEHLGISAQWLIRRTRALGAWKPVSDREVLALYAVAFWILAWELDRPEELCWTL